MKKITYIIGLLVVTATAAKAQQGFGTSTPAPSSVIDMTAANKGVLLPRVTLTGLTDVTTIPSAANALTVFNTATTTLGTANDVTPGYYYWNSTTHIWVRLLDTPVNIYNANGTLTGNRTLTLGTTGTTPNSLEFDGANGFTQFLGAIQYINNSTTGGLADYGLRTNSSALDLQLFDNNSGQLSVGTATNPLPLYMLTVGAAPIVFSTNDTPRMIIDNAGNLGIGTPTPASTLDVVPITTGADPVRFEGMNTSTSATDVMVVADPTTGVLKTKAVPAAAAATEPWNVQGTTTATQATANNQNIFIKGTVAVGDSTIPTITVGTTTIAPKLYVAGDVSTSGKFWTTNSVYADYVFEKYFNGFSDIDNNYKFKSLAEVEAFIKANKHLPGVTPINGTNKTKDGYLYNVSELTIQSLEKLEELYLHVIEQQKQIDAKDKEVEILRNNARQMNERLEKLEQALLKSKQ